ncbi:MAG: hypothetical protein ACJA1N_001964 [Saprospiraceae bacterium]
MNNFEIKGDNGFLKVKIINVFGYPNRTSHLGGYECRASIEINIPSYQVKGTFYTSTGEIFRFYEELNKCQNELKGEAEYITAEPNLEINIKYNNMGQTKITGKFQQTLSNSNCLEFEIDSDQSFIKYTVDDLAEIVRKYGNMKGIKEEKNTSFETISKPSNWKFWKFWKK